MTLDSMNDHIDQTTEKISDETRERIKTASRSFLRLHKALLDTTKSEYETQNGPIPSPNVYLQLVIDDPHFAWLRKLSSMIALFDEATSLRRPATEIEAIALINEAKVLLNFEDPDTAFNDRLQTALQNSPQAVPGYNELLKLLQTI